MELKFELPAESMPALRRIETVRRHASGRAKSFHEKRVYFDTPALSLRGCGLVLYTQRIGRQSTQIAEGWTGAGRETLRHEWPVPDETPDLKLLKSTSFGRLFKLKRMRKSIAPVFTMEMRRTVVPLQIGEDCIAELVCCTGEISGESRREAVSYVKLDLSSGEASHLFALALDLARTMPMRLTYLSNEERAYRLLAGRPQAPCKAVQPKLDRQMRQIEAERAIAVACLSQIQANEAGLASSKDPEYLHQLRVGWRRMKSAISMRGSILWTDPPRSLVSDLEWVWGILGRARNWDVFCGELLPEIARELPASGLPLSEFAAFQTRCERLRRRSGRLARDAVCTERYQRLLLNLAWIVAESHSLGERYASDTCASVEQFAGLTLRRRSRKLKGMLQAPFLAWPADRHRARIAAKKLRYACEFFQSLPASKPARKFANRLGRLQDALGQLNDLANADAMADEEARSAGHPASRALMGFLARTMKNMEADSLKKLSKVRLSLVKNEDFWRRFGRAPLGRHSRALALRNFAEAPPVRQATLVNAHQTGAPLV